ncbi:MAG: hypothetical protein KKH84_09075 [Proteobacteria bacterium]|nr:hypothetical protein [Pseudomonadota bacterium]MCG2829966.1 hypothetical protein [Desulfobacteraceae bacterium]MBU4102157.1 hypothetical protein [Pseudomonadota bacterium]MBU4209251.1 hypothetical protein [Pseudomonadota bacterium]MBU4389194.1 hypothetical protein [Pseudomonadota bacterium]
MKEVLIKTIDLENGLELKLLDASRKLAGDRWLVSLIARIEIPTGDSLLKEDGSSSLNVDEVRKVLGEKLLFEQKRERIYIDEKEKDEVLKEIQDSFLSTSLSYLSRSDFPQKYILKRFNEKIKKGSWYKDIPLTNNTSC